jgi:methionyl-tRNA formyltransferase
MDDNNASAGSEREPRAIFFGTPDFAVPCLRALTTVADVVRVVTQPDRRSGRGMRLSPTPVKALAESLGLEVAQPRKVRTGKFSAALRALEADFALVVAYGRILPPAVLSAPRLGCLNVHASLLPKYRGAAPVHWSIVGGETETGVCLMRMDEGMDTGPVLSVRKTPVGPDETAGELSERLSTMAAELVAAELPRFVRGELEPVEQDHERHTLAPLLKKEDGLVDWRQGARQVHDRVRGMSPWPGAYTFVDGCRVKLHRTHVLLEEGGRSEPGVIERADRHGIEVACGNGVLAIDELQPEGKRCMCAEHFLAGRPLRRGDRFDTGEP